MTTKNKIKLINHTRTALLIFITLAATAMVFVPMSGCARSSIMKGETANGR